MRPWNAPHRTFRAEGWQGERPDDSPAGLALLAASVQTSRTVRPPQRAPVPHPVGLLPGDPAGRLTERSTQLHVARILRRDAWKTSCAAVHLAA
jgi:hypothetical protein